MLLGIFFGLYGFFNYQKPYIINDNIYRTYLNDLEGEIDSNTYMYFDEEKEYFDGLRMQLQSLDTMYEEGSISNDFYEMAVRDIEVELSNEEVLNNIIHRTKELEGHNLPHGEKPWLIYDTGYSQLLGTRNSQEMKWNQLILLVLMVVCFAPVYSVENSMGAGILLKSTMKGRRKTYINRIIIGAVTTLILYTSINLPYLINIFNHYGTGGIDAPVQSLESYRMFPVSLTVGGFIFLVYIVRFIASLLCMWIMTSISIYSTDLSSAVTLNIGVFVLPFMVILLGVNFMESFGYNPLISGHVIFMDNKSFYDSLWLVLNGLVFGIASIILIIKTYRKACLTN